MRHIHNFTYTVETEKLGNVPDLLRKAADDYEAMVIAGTHRTVATTPMNVKLNDAVLEATKTKGTLSVIEQDVPDDVAVEVKVP